MMPDTNGETPAVLTCWKDIAHYLGKGVRTVQRWEQEFGLPVRRPNGIDHKSPVAAHPSDLDTWLETHWSRKNGGKQPRSQDSNTGSRHRDELSRLIRTSHELRAAHLNLLSETSMALQALVNSCHELNTTSLNKPPTQP